MKGKIKFFDEKRFFGFLVTEDKDLFFHGSDFLGDPENLAEGMPVQFEQGEDPKSGRLRAVKVQLIEV